MKKLWIASMMFLGFGIMSHAQIPAKKATTPAAAKSVEKKEVKAVPAKTINTGKTVTVVKPKAAPTEKTVTAAKTKVDGTPDMRYKANKVAATPAVAAGPIKKDGTPDKRFNSNKKV
ncbi:MAG: hypothetical protein ABIX01_09915 [Chitinophagaceae bacterium]